jgi:hypothetical protein
MGGKEEARWNQRARYMHLPGTGARSPQEVISMRQLINLAALALLTLVVGSGLTASGQSGLCQHQPFRGAWCGTCTGFTDLSNIDPSVPKNTLVPFSMLLRVDIDGQGKSAGAGHASVGGAVLPFETKGTFTAKPDCSGEKSYELTVPGLGIIPGKAAVVYLPLSGEFKIILLNPGDAITCVYKRIHM